MEHRHIKFNGSTTRKRTKKRKAKKKGRKEERIKSIETGDINSPLTRDDDDGRGRQEDDTQPAADGEEGADGG